jgi:hypothetical protein
MLALDFGAGAARAMLARAIADASKSTEEKRCEALMDFFLPWSRQRRFIDGEC